MAGIIASSASKAMVSGDTAASDIETGYVTGERVTLTAYPTGTTYLWSLSVPAGSAVARSGLTATDEATAYFTPDVAGEYVVSVTVDGSTAYVLRASIAAAAPATATGAVRFLPLT